MLLEVCHATAEPARAKIASEILTILTIRNCNDVTRSKKEQEDLTEC